MSASTPAAPAASATPARPPARRIPPLAVVLVASLALSLFIALKLPLLDPDEGRNAEVAREMAVSGDLVIPHLAGMPYLDKPPGFFWAAALSIRAFGHTPLAARLPSLLASLALLLILGRAATRAGGTRFGWLTAALLAAAPLFAGLSAYVIFDMMLALCVTVVWLGVTREVEEADAASRASPYAPPVIDRARTWRRVAMFAAIAAGLLIKGPVMLAWALGGSLGAALLTRSRAALAWLAWWPGWIIALGIPGAWFAAASVRFPEYPHYAFLEESFERMATGSFHRQQPWWFVPAVLVGGTLPWSLLTRWSRARLEKSARGVHIGANTGVGFMLFTLVFFTLSHSKLVTYVLPALPPLAWSAAAMWNDRAIVRRSGWMLIGLLLIVVASLGWFAYLTVLPTATLGHPYIILNRMVYLAIAALAVLAIVAMIGMVRRSDLLVVIATTAFWPLLLACTIPVGLAADDAFGESRRNLSAISGSYLADAIRGRADRPVVYKGCYSPGTDYLLGRDSRLVSHTGGETTSNYIVRYRTALQDRGLWRALDSLPPDTSAIVVGDPPPPRSEQFTVRVLRGGKYENVTVYGSRRAPWPYHRFYSDRRFSAWRFAPPGDTIVVL